MCGCCSFWSAFIACAAFFRRKVAAGKPLSSSRCSGSCKLENQVLRRLCAKCRYEKCVQVGMRTSAVLSRLAVKSEPEFESLLDQIKLAYERLQMARKEAFHTEGHIPKMIKYQEMHKMCSFDLQLVSQHFTSIFQSLTPISEAQKVTLGEYFTVPFVLLDGSYRSVESDYIVFPNGDYVDAQNIDAFYQNPDEKDESIGSSVASILEPYWRLHHQTLWEQMKKVKPSLIEFLVLSAFIFWDFGLQGQSEECIKVCNQLRARVNAELSTYEKTFYTAGDYSLRVAEVVYLLQSVQKSLAIMHSCKTLGYVFDFRDRTCPLNDNLEKTHSK
ncbi:NR LBD domain-containing protein [Caenorhabditis elegans]|uniref:NR LBD domain-containing protein n=1 Tax=Caenorhabditis elegans TaxID=6239 RepID=A0A0K3AW28_CAEEL|nr:NR LBD domain-containing protein [Caenorhabditis elegans]CTQ86957.1 NR LBD domain-containing protein [Caenorhabditis elegans]|eukprot:NP_001300258.1 Nuclear Hormone Receptor family [Caenorhabditis elegans]